jgi:GNAT superfamily N-acetyltransferase
MNERADIMCSRAAQILPGGERVTIRVVRPRDAGALQTYFRALSGESRYRRFLGAQAELNAKQLTRLTEMDGPDELALLAFAKVADTSCLIGEAVLVSPAGSARSEFALSVTDAWQRKGTGAALLADLECRARMRGTRYLYGDVLHTNVAMKNLARKAGYALRSPFTDARLIEIVKDLAVAAPDLPCRERFARFTPTADRDVARSLAGPARDRETRP